MRIVLIIAVAISIAVVAMVISTSLLSTVRTTPVYYVTKAQLKCLGGDVGICILCIVVKHRAGHGYAWPLSVHMVNSMIRAVDNASRVWLLQLYPEYNETVLVEEPTGQLIHVGNFSYYGDRDTFVLCIEIDMLYFNQHLEAVGLAPAGSIEKVWGYIVLDNVPTIFTALRS